MERNIINHLHICSLVYCGNRNLAIKIFDKNLKTLIDQSGFTYCSTFIDSLNYSIYNYVLVKEGISLHNCCFKNSLENFDPNDISSLKDIGHKIIDSYSYCKEYLYEKYSHVEIKKAIFYIHENLDEDLSLDNICSIINMNKTYFCKLFKKYTNRTLSEYINITRINAAKHLMLDPQVTLLQVSLLCGFNNYSYFCKLFKEIVGITPTEYKNQKNKNEILDVKN